MNCHNCMHMVINDDKTLHCYMFKNEPTSVCAQFKPADEHSIHANFKQVNSKTLKSWLTNYVTKK